MSTIAIPSPVPSAADDAEGIQKALQGWRADKEALVRILAHRTAAQRTAIRRAYAFLYREPMLNSFRNRLARYRNCPISIDFWKAIILWSMEPAERDANLVHRALRRRDGDYLSVLAEVACAYAPDHLAAVRRTYCSLFGCSVEEDLASSAAFEQPLKKMLVSLLSSYRYGGEQVDEDVARLEAAQLSEAIRKKEPHGDDVIRIVGTRSKAQLGATLRRYRDDHHGTDFVEDIDSHCSSQFAKTLKSAVWCLTSPEKHFAEVIRHSILGLGTYEDMLTRAVVSRAEIDMKQIKAEYIIRFKTTVTRDVAGDTSFCYKDILLALVGSEEECVENMERCFP